MNCVKDHIITDNFQLLAGTLSPAEALTQLVNYTYGVVLDEHSKPVALVMADDLERAKNQGSSSLLDINVGFPPTIIVGCLVDMQDLVKWESLINSDEKIRGVIVIDDNTVVGILPVAAIREYLKNRDYQLRGNMGCIYDTGLGGDHQPSKLEFMCHECHFVNKLSYIDWNNLPICQNPNKQKHELKLS
jgi:hypothetical protein